MINILKPYITKKVFSALPVLLLTSLLFTNATYAAKTLTVGVVPQFEVRRIAEIWQPILKEVSLRSGVNLELKTSPSIPVFEQQFSDGEFDFAYMNPYHAVVANNKQGYIPIIRDIGRKLFGIIVVRKDSPLQSVKQLDGKKVAFPAPNALGAALIPRAEFVRKFKIKVEELYVKSHSSVYLNVLLGKTDAGGGVQKTLNQQPDNIRNNLRILYKTSEVAPHPFTAHRRVTRDIQEKVKAAFLALGDDARGRKLLEEVPIKKVGLANMADYEPLMEMGLEEFYVEK